MSVCSNTNILTFDYAQFIALIPAYSDPTAYPEATLQAYWDSAINYINDTAGWTPLCPTQRQYALNLMTAHLIYIANLAASGTVPYLMQNATIDKVTVGLTPPPLKNQWQWWMMLSPYGQQCFALLQSMSVGGFYIGGSPALAGFANGQYGYGWGW